MENKKDIQVILFNRIRDSLPNHVSMVDEIAELLNLSNDSAYRRIRGDKAISIYETELLIKKYGISLEEISGASSNSLTFTTSLLDNSDYPFKLWLKQLLDFTRNIKADPETEVIFILNELNIFHLIQFPELCAFKLFFWQKSNLGFDEFKDSLFSLNSSSEDTLTVYKELAQKYVKLNTIEFTTAECLNSFLKQVHFYNDAGYFSSSSDAANLCSELHLLVNHMQKQAQLGYKYVYGNPETGINDTFKLYHNDIVLVDNTILIKNVDQGTTFITSNAINLMQTGNPDFFDYNYRWGSNLMSKSVLISGSAERERSRFFNNLHRQVEALESKL